MIGADGGEISSRGGIASHHQMLAVVNDISGRRVDEGARSSAREGTLFENKHTPPATAQINRGAETGKTGTDNEDVGRGHNSK